MKNGMPSVEEIQGFYYRGAAQGWASSSCVKVPDPGLPGFKVITYQEGPFLMVDRYCVGQTDGETGLTPSFGSKVILWRDKPVWMMDYGGSYTAKAIPVVKQALLVAYAQRDGVRGSSGLRVNSLVYTISKRLEDTSEDRGWYDSYDFVEFSGRESVRENEAEDQGFHDFHGGLLIKP